MLTDKMTAQEIFDHVVTHLRRQGQQCLGQNPNSTVIAGDNCLYRGTNNFKCAAGCLIDDDEYKTEMEGRDIEMVLGLPDCNVNLRKRLLPHIGLIAALQRIHDARQPNEWETRWWDLAEKHSLNYLPPKNDSLKDA
jgi:hypothetical protein